ncbi:hypothetical protein NRB_15760 [Novosphingobium sp. 11B]
MSVTQRPIFDPGLRTVCLRCMLKKVMQIGREFSVARPARAAIVLLRIAYLTLTANEMGHPGNSDYIRRPTGSP